MMDSIAMLVERKDSGNINGIFNTDSVDDLVNTLLLTVLDITSGTRKITRILINNRLLECKIGMPNNNFNIIIQYHFQANVEILGEITPDISLDIKEETDSDGFSNCFIGEKQQCMKKEIELEFPPYDKYIRIPISDNGNANSINKYELNSLNNFKLQPNEEGTVENESTHLVGVIRETPSSDYSVNDNLNFTGKENHSQSNEHDKGFQMPSYKISNEENQFGKKSYPCHVCGKSFPVPSKRKIHEQTHTDEKPYSCEICGKSFTRLSYIDTHKRIHTGERPYSCEICGKSFTRLSHKDTHKRIHTGRPYSCEICGKSFTRLAGRVKHRHIHTGEKPYSCEMCGKPFTDLKTRDMHKRIHTGEKPYSCEICGKTFTQRRIRDLHKCIHTGEKPYSCEICGKSFARLSHKTTHKRVHTGEKPYSCELCGKSFTQLSSMYRHKRIHTRQKSFFCSFFLENAFQALAKNSDMNEVIIRINLIHAVHVGKHFNIIKIWLFMKESTREKNLILVAYVIKSFHKFNLKIYMKKFIQVRNLVHLTSEENLLHVLHQGIYLNGFIQLRNIFLVMFVERLLELIQAKSHMNKCIQKAYSCCICRKPFSLLSNKLLHEKPTQARNFIHIKCVENHSVRHRIEWLIKKLHALEKPYGKSFKQILYKITHEKFIPERNLFLVVFVETPLYFDQIKTNMNRLIQKLHVTSVVYVENLLTVNI